VRPGATSAVLRWRVGAWLVGTGALLFVADLLFLDQGPGFWSLCLFLVVIGSLIANPLRMMGRLRAGGHADPVIRLRPLGIIGYVVMMVLFLVPFAIGEWFLNMIGERSERRAGRPSNDEDGMALAPDEETLAGHPPVPWPGAEGFEDIFFDEQDPNRRRLSRARAARRRLTRR
jgi:hypothetical protein